MINLIAKIFHNRYKRKLKKLEKLESSKKIIKKKRMFAYPGAIPSFEDIQKSPLKK